MANKSGVAITDPGVGARLGNPMPQYIPLADVSFGPMQIVLPHQLPPSDMVFPNPSWNGMLNIPSVHVLYDEKRNGIAF